jgi:glycosyltransferase involved in cell wall biosynthesis
MNKKITAIVFARNEESRILKIFENLKDFCPIIVFDGGSTDGTEDICRRNGISFISRIKDDSEMRLIAQKWVYDNTPTEYVLQVYCAHFYPKSLLKYFDQVANEGKIRAVFHDVIIYRYGAIVHRPIVRRVSSACVFYDKKIITFEKSKLHDELAIKFDSNTMIRLPGCDENSLHLFQDEDCESFARKTINYAAFEARQRFASGERSSVIGILVGSVGRFFYQYVRTGSFTKGSKGLVYSVLNLIYDFNVCIILWELTNQLTFEDAIRMNAEKKAQLQKDGV